jgi:hypothetical protein
MSSFRLFSSNTLALNTLLLYPRYGVRIAPIHTRFIYQQILSRAMHSYIRKTAPQ